MGISIKHDEYERAIRELASVRGVSLTEAVGQAVRNELERGRVERVPSYREQVADLHALVANVPVLDDRTPNEIIGYDEHGLSA